MKNVEVYTEDGQCTQETSKLK